MISQKHRNVIITTFLFMQSVITSLEIKKSDDPYDVRIAKKLIKHLEEKIKEARWIEVNRNNEEDGPIMNNDEEEPGNIEQNSANDEAFTASGDLNRVLVKRIVPHDFPASKYDYINHDSHYRPLFRIHKSRGTNPETASNSIDRDSDSKNMNLVYVLISSDGNKPTRSELDLHNDGYPIQAFGDHPKLHQRKTKQKQALNDARNHLDFLLDYLKTNSAEKEKLLQNDRGLLRSPIFTKSGERHDIIHSAIMLPGSKSENTTKKPKWLPKYPPWNYWTYKKSIYQDECPGLQINIGGMCVWIPPH